MSVSLVSLIISRIINIILRLGSSVFVRFQWASGAHMVKGLSEGAVLVWAAQLQPVGRGA